MIRIEYLKAHVQCRENGSFVQVMTLPARNFGRALQPESWVFFKSNGSAAAVVVVVVLIIVIIIIVVVVVFVITSPLSSGLFFFLLLLRLRLQILLNFRFLPFLEATHRGQGICADCCGWPQ